MQNSALNKADARLLHIWHNFNNYEEELSDDDFPAWLLLHEPVVDLIYFEGPLLTLFENEYGDSYLYYWCDDELQCQQCCLIQPQNLPPKYLPAVDSYYDFSKLDPEDTEAKGLILEKIWDEKHELSDLLTKLFDKPPLEMIDEPSLA
jgi:hypothetical protein